MSPPTTEPLSGLTGTSGKKGKPLGFVTWFSIPDEPVSLKRLKTEWAMAGLDTKMLPPEPRPLGLFKRAMRAQEGRVRLDDGTIIETDVKDVAENDDLCVYQISRVVRDADKRVVDYPKALRVTFIKAKNEGGKYVAEDMKFDPLGGVPRADFWALEESISDFYEKHAKLMEGRKVRNLVRAFISGDADEEGGKAGLSGENLRGRAGGVYFVLAQHQAALEGVAQALNELWGEGRAFLYMVPMMDGRDSREIIRRHHVNNSVKEVHEAIADVAKLLRKDRQTTPRSDVVEWHWRRLRQLKRRAEAYTGLLHEESEEVQIALEMMGKQLQRLGGV